MGDQDIQDTYQAAYIKTAPFKHQAVKFTHFRSESLL